MYFVPSIVILSIMVYTKPLAAIAAASLFARLAVAFDAQSQSNVVVYYVRNGFLFRDN